MNCRTGGRYSYQSELAGFRHNPVAAVGNGYDAQNFGNKGVFVRVVNRIAVIDLRPCVKLYVHNRTDFGKDGVHVLRPFVKRCLVLIRNPGTDHVIFAFQRQGTCAASFGDVKLTLREPFGRACTVYRYQTAIGVHKGSFGDICFWEDFDLQAARADAPDSRFIHQGFVYHRIAFEVFGVVGQAVDIKAIFLFVVSRKEGIP